MDDLKQLNILIGQVYKLSNKITDANNFKILVDTNTDLVNENNLLKEELVVKIKELDDVKNKYDHDMNIKNNELKEKCEELKNLTKVSFVQSLNKQLNDKNLIIQQLENQILKLKMCRTNESNTLVNEPIKEQVKETTELNTLILKKNKEKHINHFDPDNFEDINGYELILYKKNYYLRDLETNELYNIIDNKPGEIVGLLSSKGKVKFN